MQKSIPSVLSERVYPVVLQMQNESAQRKPAKQKETSRGKFLERGSTNVSKTDYLGSEEETFWRPKEAYSSNKILFLPSATYCLGIEQFFLVFASVYNKRLNAQSLTKQELPKCQLFQKPTYQIDSLKKKFIEKLYSKADFLVDKFLSCSRIMVTNSQTLLTDSVEMEFSC